MNSVQAVLQQVQQTSGNNDKMALIKRSASLLNLTDVLQFIYNPYFKTGISAAKARAALGMSWSIPETQNITYPDIMAYLKQHNTGSDADLYQVACFLRSHRDTEWLAMALVTQDLKIGVTSTSLNKIFGKSFIPKVGCMLGTPYEDVKNVIWPCIVTEKLDGIRRLLIKEEGVCRFYSRSGHVDEGLIDIENEAKYLPDNHVYDGELIAIGNFKDSIAVRQATSSLSSSNGAKTGLVYNIFDMLPLQEFYNGSRTNAVDRKTRLAALFGDTGGSVLAANFEDVLTRTRLPIKLKYITAVPILGYVDTFEDATTIVSAIWNRGGEGVMLNTWTGTYEVKRSKELLKVKHVEEHTLLVKGVAEGNGKYQGMAGALLVEYKGQLVGVGSGLTDAMRQVIWSKQENYIGRMIEIECFGESTNAGGTVSLNCPIFKRFKQEG